MATQKRFIAKNGLDNNGLSITNVADPTNAQDVATKAFVLASASASGVSSVNTRTGAVTLTSSDVGLGSANNTSDASKPISTATQTALDLKASLASPTLSNPTYTGTLTGSTGILNIGSGQVYKDGSGKVGINVVPVAGTNAKLQITGLATNATTLATAYSNASLVVVPKSTSGYSLAIASGTGDLPQLQVSANGAASGDLLIQPYGGNVGIGTASPVTSLTVQAGSGTGIKVYDASAGVGGTWACIESIGSRGDGNGSFGGRFGAGSRRTDGTAIATGSALGTYAFGGQWGTGTTYNQTNFLYTAAVVGISEGSFTSATAMPTALVFRTGSTGASLQSINVDYGTERMRITSAGGVSFGSSGTAYGTSGQVLTSAGNAAPTWTTPTTGTVTGVTGTAPVVSSGGTAPAISMSAASSAVNGYMTGVYATKLDGIATGATANTGTVTSVATSGNVSGITLTGGTITGSGTITLGGAIGTLNQNTTGSSGSCTGNAATATTATSATYLNSSNYISRAGSSGNANTDFQNTPAGSVRHNGDDANLTNGPGNTWWFYNNYRHSNGSNYWGTQVAWGWEDNANRLATRNVSGGGFGAWVYYLNSSNYTSYAPSLTGSGASGTWGISVTGSSASCTGNAASATTATSQSGGTVSATTGAFSGTTSFPCAQGAFNIQNGTGDGASFTVYNTAIHSHWGIGFRDYQDLTTVKAYIDCRSGNIGTSGSFVGNLSGNAATATTAGALQGLTSGANGSIYTDVNWAMLLQGFTNGGSFGWRPTNAVSIAFSCSNTGNLNAIGTISGTNITTGGNVTGSSASCTGNAVTATSLTTIVGSAPSYACRAWVNFNGTGTVAIRASGNVSSITDNGGGDYTVNFTTAMPDAKYSAVANCNGVSTTSLAPHMFGSGQGIASYTASSVKIQLEHGGVSPADREVVTVAIFR